MQPRKREPIGHFQGRHFTEWVVTVRKLKRQKKYDRAEEILLGLLAAARREAKRRQLSVPPWYEEQIHVVRTRRERARRMREAAAALRASRENRSG